MPFETRYASVRKTKKLTSEATVTAVPPSMKSVRSKPISGCNGAVNGWSCSVI
jgi:hypothetical protein